MHNTTFKEAKHEETSLTALFFNLIRCGIGKSTELLRTPTDDEWQELFDIASKQTLIGITYSGIEHLPKEQRPPKRLLLAWHTASEEIKKKNTELNRKSIAVSMKFTQLGFRNCILKGQGLAVLYPNPELRTPGDIDIWLEGGHRKILGYVRKCFPRCKPTYHHVDFPIKKGFDIEVHFTPSWLYNPISNRRLQKLFTATSSEQFCNMATTPEGNFATPTLAFNRIYALLHIYRHLFQEGIGLRQLLDYYFILEKGFTPLEKAECAKQLKRLGLTNIAAAVTHVLEQTFSLEADKQIVQPDARRGRFLLREIMTAGNFGRYDSRYAIVSKEKEFHHFLNSMQRTARLIKQYPGETFWSPLFKLWHHIWRKCH